MNNAVKIGLYIGLVILAAVSGFFSMTRFKEIMDTDRTIDVEIEKERPAVVEEPATTPPPQTNEPATDTNLTTTNASILTNLASLATNMANQIGSGATNIASTATNPPTTPEVEAPPAETVPSQSEIPTALSGRASTSGKKGGVGLWTGLFVLSLIGLGLLIANDVSHYFGNRALKVLYNEDADGMANPEYEAAEQVWANGKHLEAIRMMREYLNKHPREQFVALRIAEIYEKDLGNFLAAALEYEEVLKHKLPAERWGWAAIHLCNLYFKLNQEEKAFDLLRRLVKEYPDTAAAEKARKRLEHVDGPSEPTQVLTEDSVRAAQSSPPQDNSGLPPGFRRKK